MMYVSLSDYPKALESFQASLRISEQIEYKKSMAMNFSSLGVVYVNLGDYPKALENFLKSLTLSEQLGDKTGIAKIYGNLGVLYTELSDYPKAIAYCEKALAANRKLGRKFGIGITLSSLGRIYYEMNENKKALDYYNQSMEVCEQVGDESGIAACMANIGGVYFNTGNYLKALEYANKSYSKYIELDDQAGACNSLYNIGDIYFKCDHTSLLKMNIHEKERFSKAIEKLNMALQIATKIEALDLQRNALEELSQVYEKQNNIPAAYQYYKKFIAVRDSIVNGDKKKELAQKQFQYEVDKREGEIKLLSTENKLKTALAEKESQRKNFAFAGIGLILFTGSYGFYRFRKKKQLQNQQSIMNERLRISRELHDEVGATLSGIAMYSHLTKEQIKHSDITEVEKSLSIMQQSAGEMVSKLSDIVWLVNPDQDSLQKLIQRLEEYARDMAAIKNMQVQINVPDNLHEHSLPMESRRNIYLFCKEAINNAVKYSDGILLELTIKETNKTLEFSVSDNGKGFDVDNIKRGNGLNNMQKRADEIGAKFMVRSKQEDGTMVSMCLTIA